MKKIVAFTILLFSTLISFGQTDDEIEACKVYKAVLDDEKPLVILDSIFGERFGKHPVFSKRNPKLAVVQPETLKNYKKGNVWCDPMNLANLETKTTLITSHETQSYFEKFKADENADILFIEKYKTDHYFTFSTVGFNKKRDQALLTMQWQCISLRCTDCLYIVLSKINGEWKIVRKEAIWVS